MTVPMRSLVNKTRSLGGKLLRIILIKSGVLSQSGISFFWCVWNKKNKWGKHTKSISIHLGFSTPSHSVPIIKSGEWSVYWDAFKNTFQIGIMGGLRRKVTDNARNESGQKDRGNYGDTGEQKALYFKVWLKPLTSWEASISE